MGLSLTTLTTTATTITNEIKRYMTMRNHLSQLRDGKTTNELTNIEVGNKDSRISIPLNELPSDTAIFIIDTIQEHIEKMIVVMWSNLLTCSEDANQLINKIRTEPQPQLDNDSFPKIYNPDDDK